MVCRDYDNIYGDNVIKTTPHLYSRQLSHQTQSMQQQHHFAVYEKKTNTTTTTNDEDILKQFPKIKFSYESKHYKKVSHNKSNIDNHDDNHDNKEFFYFIIPKGKKYFVWFKNNNCYFLELNTQREITSIQVKNVSHMFPNNTVLYGTHFYVRQNSNGNNYNTYYFTIENIHYFDGLHLDTTSVVDKFKKINKFFNQQSLNQQVKPIQSPHSQKQYNSSIEIGIPYISSSFKDAHDMKPFYHPFCIQKKCWKNSNNEYENIFYFNSISNAPNVSNVSSAPNVSNVSNVSTRNSSSHTTSQQHVHHSKYKIFMVRADLQNDIYHLSDPNGNIEDNELIASIPNYKTSVMMNFIFRKIKENNSLDALEESDDENEFENINIDKFVDMSKKILMKCVYNHKFKKWTPITQISQ
jgi:hypothetical protein